MPKTDSEKEKKQRREFLKQAAETLLETKKQLLKEMQGRVKEETEGVKDEGRDTYDLASDERDREINFILNDREREKLLAAQMSVEGMADYINADSLAFVSIDGLYRALGTERDHQQPQRCDACFTGDYPTTLTDLAEKEGAIPLSLVASR